MTAPKPNVSLPSTRRARRALAALASAGTLLVTTAASAQQIYESVPASNAQKALTAFLGTTTAQIDGGENPPRDNATNGSMMWWDANTVEMIWDYTDATGDKTFLPIAESYRGYDPSYPFWWLDPSPFQWQQFNSANDDTMWWALAFIRAYDTIGDGWYLTAAENVFERACSQWNTVGCGGGVPWKEPGNGSDSTYLNAITNELFMETAAKLAIRDPSHGGVCSTQSPPNGTPNTYESWAWAEYQWFTNAYLGPGSALPIPDGVQPASGSCSASGTSYSYNQGVILGALVDLSTIASNEATPPATPTTILQHSLDIADAVMSPVAVGGMSQNGVLTDLADVGGSQNGCLDDSNGSCPEFKGIFMRYLGRLVNGLGPYQNRLALPLNPFLTASEEFLEQNATAIWTNSSSPGMLTENWGVEQTYGSFPSQPTETSALDGLIAAISIPMIYADPIVAQSTAPTITGLSETIGYTGDTITVTGTNFSTTPGATSFSFGSAAIVPYYACTSTTSCSTSVPEGAGTVSVTATVGTQRSLPGPQFTYNQPTVTGLSPSSTTTVGGTWVTITGQGLVSGMTVYFGDVATTAQCGETACYATAPPYPPSGIVDVTVNVGGESSATSTADQFIYYYWPAPASLTFDVSALWTGGTAIGTVTLNESAAYPGLQIDVTAIDEGTSEPATGITVPPQANIVVPWGETSVTFPITVSAVAPASVRFSASTNGGTLLSSALPVCPGDICVAGAGTVYVVAGATIDLNVLLRTAVPAGGSSISVSSSSSFVASTSFPVAAGATSATIPIATSKTSALSYATLTLGYEGTTEEVQVTIRPTPIVLPPIHPPPIHCVGDCI